MYSGIYTINIYQGTSFQLQLNAKDPSGNAQNLSGYSGFCGMKYRYSDSGIFGSLDVSFPVPESGNILLSMSSTGTASLFPTQAIFELDIADSIGNISNYLYGYVNVYPQIVQWP